MIPYSFEDVVKIDNALHQLAIYEVTGGMIIVPKSHEEFIELQEKIANKFNYFKGLIQRKECSFQYIKETVLEKNGPFPKSDAPDFDKIEPKDVDKIEDVEKNEKTIQIFAEELLRSLLPLSKESDDIVDKFGIKIAVKPTDSIDKNSTKAKNKLLPSPKKINRKKNPPKNK